METIEKPCSIHAGTISSFASMPRLVANRGKLPYSFSLNAFRRVSFPERASRSTKIPCVMSKRESETLSNDNVISL